VRTPARHPPRFAAAVEAKVLSEAALLEICRTKVGLDERAFADEFLCGVLFQLFAFPSGGDDGQRARHQQLLLDVDGLKHELATAEAALDALPAAAVAEAEQLERGVRELKSRIAHADAECAEAERMALEPKNPLVFGQIRGSDWLEFLAMAPSELRPLMDLGMTALLAAKAAEKIKRARPGLPSSRGSPSGGKVAPVSSPNQPTKQLRGPLSLRSLLQMRALVSAAAQKMALAEGLRVRRASTP
jgi:hypothetical protein